MKKLITITAITTLMAASSAFADTVPNDQADVQADVGAIHKDNAALNKDRDSLAKDRAAKADDKANENYGHQAKDSVAIGVDQTAIGEKKVEKNVDQKILNHHQNELDKDQSIQGQ
jgi:hypothetical protein